MITSIRDNTLASNIYYETIYDDNKIICYIHSYKTSSTTNYVMTNNVEQFYIKGFDTVADAKEAFFKLYEASN